MGLAMAPPFLRQDRTAKEDGCPLLQSRAVTK
jgi:hypothetical protein